MEDDGEFLASIPRDPVVNPDALAENLGHGLQGRIPGLVAVLGVESLEMVQVEHEQGKGDAETPELGNARGHFLIEIPAVEQPGQGILVSAVFLVGQ